MSDDCSDAYSRAVRLLSRRDHSEQELRRKLEQKGHLPASVDAAIDRLKQLNYLDDRRFAAMWVNNSLNRNRFFGNRLEMELQRLGVSAEIAAEAVGSAMAGRNEQELLDDLLDRKFPRFNPGAATVSERRRVFDFLRRRGFSTSHIVHAMRLAKEE